MATTRRSLSTVVSGAILALLVIAVTACGEMPTDAGAGGNGDEIPENCVLINGVLHCDG